MSRRVSAAIGLAAVLATSHLQAAAMPFYPPFGLDLSAIDPSVRPADDFFQYANGAWLARTPIPADKPGIGTGRELADRVEARLRTLLEAEAAKATARPVTVAQKVGAMYAAFMDEAAIERLGARPIEPELSAIRAATDRTALAALMGASLYDFGGSIFAVGIDADLKDPAHYAVYLNQSGLGLPDRDYYLKPDFAAQKTAYQAYIARILTLIGWPGAPQQAAAIVAMETGVADASWTKAQQRDLPKLYNPASPAELAQQAPGFAWTAFLKSAMLATKTRLIVGEKSAFPKIAAIFAQTSVDTLKAWLAFNVADTAAPSLSHDFQAAHFEFRDKTLSGQPQIRPRWKRGITAVAGGDCGDGSGDCFGTLRWAVGQVYTAHDFTPETKAKAGRLVANLLAAFHARLQRLDWMGPATKTEALKKLDTYTVKIGYPDHARDYTAVAISRRDLVGDMRNAAAADWQFAVGRSDGPVDRTDWGMTPQTVDAYNGSLRDIVFPAAILQPPFFDPAADDAINYGAIGAVIGHELTHGFDDQGRTIDAAGALRDWWTPQDAAAFKARAALLGAEFAAFEPVPGLHINPDLTMGENIADLGGVVIGLEAYHASLKGQRAPLLAGFTGDQRFFMSWAQNWRGKSRPDAIRQQTVRDPHSYRRFRVLGPLPNVDAWYTAFSVKPDDHMYRAPAVRAHIW